MRVTVTPDGVHSNAEASTPHSTTFDTPTFANDVLQTLAQARSDLAALHLGDVDTVAAGLPLYIAIFGRDTLTTGWQAGLLGSGIMSGRTSYRVLDKRGTLHVVRQATPWSLTSQPAERLRDALASLVGG